MSWKFFGTSAVTNLIVGDGSPSWKTPTFITIIGFVLGRQMHTRMDSPYPRWRIISTPTKFVFSPISLVGYISNLVRSPSKSPSHGFLTTSGKQRMGSLFSNVTGSFSLFSLPLTDTFSGISGKLEGERVVGELIQDRPCEWCHVEPLPSQQQVGLPVNLPNPPSTSATTTPTSVWTSVDDWRDAIFRVLHSPDTKICIRMFTESVSG